jgi:NADPH:quinone reductase-like Zn-dependent oxidoreductase
MRALVLDRPGTPDSLRLATLPAPEAGANQLRVRVEACGLNPVDVQVAGGGRPEWVWPHVLGLDVVGLVDQLGPGVSGWRIGQRVAWHGDLTRPGGLAEWAVARVDTVAAVPDGLAPEAVAALPCAGMTAFQAVNRRLHVGPDDTVLVTAGAGGVGGFAIQLAALAGARVLTTASAGQADRLRGLGAAEVIDYHVVDVADRVRELTSGRGLDAVVDTRGPDSAGANLRLLVFGGRLASVAGRPDLSAVPPFTTAPSVHEIALGAAHQYGDRRARAELATMLAELMGLLAAGRLDPMVAAALPLERVPWGLTEILGGHVHGKLVYLAG